MKRSKPASRSFLKASTCHCGSNELGRTSRAFLLLLRSLNLSPFPALTSSERRGLPLSVGRSGHKGGRAPSSASAGRERGGRHGPAWAASAERPALPSRGAVLMGPRALPRGDPGLLSGPLHVRTPPGCNFISSRRKKGAESMLSLQLANSFSLFSLCSRDEIILQFSA